MIDFPFDRDHHTVFDGLSRLERFRAAGARSKTIAWLPSFLSDRLQTQLGRFVVLEHLLSNDDRLRQYSSHLSQADRAEAKTELTNHRDQLCEQLKRALRMAYGVMNPEAGVLDESLSLEKDQQFQSLDATIPIRPPAAADLRSALDNLIEQGLDGQYPAHPKFSKDELRLTTGLVQQAFDKIREALEAPDSRVAIDRDLRKKLRPLLDPLELAHVGEQFLAVKTVWFDRFDPREAQRLHVDFALEDRFDNPRAVQIRLRNFDLNGLVEVGTRVRDLFAEGSPAEDRIRQLADDAYLETLARAMVGALGGKVGLAPRLYLKKLVGDVLDRIEQFPDFDPRKHYALTLARAELSLEEKAATSPGGLGVDDIELKT